MATLIFDDTSEELQREFLSRLEEYGVETETVLHKGDLFVRFEEGAKETIVKAYYYARKFLRTYKN